MSEECEEVLPDDRSIMRETRWGGEFKPDMSRCRVGVSFKVGRGYDRKQCKNAVKVKRLVDGPHGPEKIGYCSTHDPVKVAERDAERSERWKREAQHRQRVYQAEDRVKRSQPDFEKALVEIAQGTSDPAAAAVAREVLDKWSQVRATGAA